MTQRAALTELIAKIQAGTDRPEDIAKCFGVTPWNKRPYFKATESTDDAILLILSLLPRAWFAVTGPLKDGWYCGVYGYRPFADSHHPTSLARALLIAGLRAYRDTLPEEDA